ncbi:MAG: hypothetical protein CND37_05795, partial [Bacteroidetes bacterium MED-G20]
ESSTGGLDTATISSPAIDLTGSMDDAELTFWVHGHGADIGTMIVTASALPGGTVDTLAVFSGQITSFQTQDFALVGANISQFMGGNMYVNLTYIRGASFRGDFAVDLMSVNSCVVPPSDDIGVTDVELDDECEFSSTESITVHITNFGLVSQSTYDVAYSVNGGTPVVENANLFVDSNSTVPYTFTSTVDMSSDGTYDLVAYTIMSNDVDTGNDTLYASVENLPNPPAPTTTDDTICGGDTAVVTGTGDDYIYWYDAATGGNLVGDGEELHVSPSATSSYYAEAAYMDYFFEDFEDYNDGDFIALFNPNGPWVTWPGGTPGALYDAPVSNAQASSGSNSLHLDNAASNTPDPVLLFDTTWDEGSFEFTMDMYVVTTGYFNLQGDVTPATVWAMEMTFDNAGGFDLGGGALAGPYPGPGVWFNISLQCVDLTEGTWELFIDGSSQGSVTLLNGTSVGGANFYAAAGNNYYIDNVMWSSPLGELACKSESRTEAIVNVEDCSNINEISSSNLGIYPNPNDGEFSIVYSEDIINVVITDLSGKVIYSNYNINSRNVNIDMNNYERGVYLTHIDTPNGKITKTVVIQ